jgi:hypothetical protein
VAEREEPQEGAEGTEPPQDGAGPGAPLDEEAAWAQIIAGYGTEPDGPGGWPEAENLPPDEPVPDSAVNPAVNTGIPAIPRAFVVKAPPLGPRDHAGFDDDDDEGHFVPPEPPPLPEADVTTKFAWLAVLGGPALMLAYVLTGVERPWWATVVGVGGFLGGFATLIARMRDPDEDDDDPHGGAVV